MKDLHQLTSFLTNSKEDQNYNVVDSQGRLYTGSCTATDPDAKNFCDNLLGSMQQTCNLTQTVANSSLPQQLLAKYKCESHDYIDDGDGGTPVVYTREGSVYQYGDEAINPTGQCLINFINNTDYRCNPPLSLNSLFLLAIPIGGLLILLILYLKSRSNSSTNNADGSTNRIVLGQSSSDEKSNTSCCSKLIGKFGGPLQNGSSLATTVQLSQITFDQKQAMPEARL